MKVIVKIEGGGTLSPRSVREGVDLKEAEKELANRLNFKITDLMIKEAGDVIKMNEGSFIGSLQIKLEER